MAETKLTQKDYDTLSFGATSTAWMLAEEYAEMNDKDGMKLIYPRLEKSTLSSLERLKKIVGE